MYVLLWLNSAAVQMFFIERYFCFLRDIVLEEDWNNINHLSARKLQCHSRRSKLISKILFIYRQNILAKQLSQAMCYE